MDREPKKEYLQIRITPTEKQEIEAKAKSQGFDSVSAFILWLFRKFGKS